MNCSYKCPYWDSANECCSIAEMADYDVEKFYELCSSVIL